MSTQQQREALPLRTVLFAVLLIVGGAAGLVASFSLTMDKLALAVDPNAALTCSVNDTVQCARNIVSWQGSVFGFPNPILGLMMFPAPVIVGATLLAGARLRAWYWWTFTAGMWFAAGFVYWLAFESIFSLHTLCPWCALVYLVTIPMWVSTTWALLRSGSAGAAAKRFADRSGNFPPILLAVLGLLLIFGIAQLQLGILQSFFG